MTSRSLAANKIHDLTQKPVVLEARGRTPGRKGGIKFWEKNRRSWNGTHLYGGSAGAGGKDQYCRLNLNTGLRFRIHEESERVMVEVVDLDENEVIRRSPEKILNMVAQIQNIIGLLIDTRRETWAWKRMGDFL